MDSVINFDLAYDWRNWVIVWFITLVILFGIHFFIKGWNQPNASFTDGPLPNGTALPPSQMPPTASTNNWSMSGPGW